MALAMTTATKSVDTKTALLDAAEAVARSYGYDGFSYAHLADEVGIRKASIHYHFPAKTDLALALIRRYRQDLLAVANNIDARFATGAGKLNALISIYRDALAGGERLCLCVAFSIGRDGFDQAVVDELDGFRQDRLSWLKAVFALGKQDGTIARVGDAGKEAAAAFAMLEGAQLRARTTADPTLFDGSIALLADRLTLA